MLSSLTKVNTRRNSPINSCRFILTLLVIIIIFFIIIILIPGDFSPHCLCCLSNSRMALALLPLFIISFYSSSFFFFFLKSKIYSLKHSNILKICPGHFSVSHCFESFESIYHPSVHGF